MSSIQTKEKGVELINTLIRDMSDRSYKKEWECKKGNKANLINIYQLDWACQGHCNEHKRFEPRLSLLHLLLESPLPS